MSQTRAACLLLCLALASVPMLVLAQADVAVPPLAARVTDLTATLSASQKDELERTLQAFEEDKGSQIAVLMVSTTQPEAIEQYSIRVAEKWKLGRKGIDDGALLLVAKNDRALRIEVGYGLEGVLPDAIAKRIVSDIITPYFSNGDFFGGIRAGVLSMIKQVEGEPLPAPVSQAGADGSDFGDVLMLGLILVFIVAPMLRGMLGRFPAALVIGLVAAVAGWVLLSTLLIALMAGFFAFVLALLSGIIPHDRGGYRPGGYGGGGFGGGGGGFGGGGASGRW